jgi:hypothetical protein
MRSELASSYASRNRSGITASCLDTTEVAMPPHHGVAAAMNRPLIRRFNEYPPPMDPSGAEPARQRCVPISSGAPGRRCSLIFTRRRVAWFPDLATSRSRSPGA